MRAGVGEFWGRMFQGRGSKLLGAAPVKLGSRVQKRREVLPVADSSTQPRQ